MDADLIKQQAIFDFYTYESYSSFENLLAKYMAVKGGKILDIGCGQSPFIVNMISGDYEFWAIDKSKHALTFLRKRIPDEHSLKVKALREEFDIDLIQGTIFDGIILSNFLHFFNYSEIEIITRSILNCTSAGTTIYIRVHSNKHPLRNLQNISFKHFFSVSDLYKLFPKKSFHYMYVSHILKSASIEQKEFDTLYYGRMKEAGLMNDFQIQEYKKLNNKSCCYEVVLVRK